MKTQLKNIILTGLTIFSLSGLAFTSTAAVKVKAPRAIILDNGFKRILVSGDVELLIVQNKIEGLVYDESNLGKAKVVKEGNILTITSSGTETAKLILYVNDFYRIDASGNAKVKNYGELNLNYLQIFLKDNATAEINSKTTGLYTVLNDNANLKLDGVTDNYILAKTKTSKLTIDKFYATTVQNSPDEFLAETK
ncbi:hypothetical protein EZJ43_11015 [Pedobacter changchengzhani]|uniref:Auto-transporter adhesin head GIN domain-containing protein n=1 Tax=Pedobacter changchengzhani TaxID=2529274 RepID=A0A4R5MLB0_9SPHI|nr:hypothetical protein [Pedobacter changchengzhani]TDG35879.1 hypothetical protein EZJ43_11015 [Pedobacter changchengzhani]